MKLIIDIPDMTYESIMKYQSIKEVGADFIRQGTVLPKGHGRLIDADKLKVDLVKTYEKAPTEKALLFVSLLLDNNEEVPTVIEADKENRND